MQIEILQKYLKLSTEAQTLLNENCQLQSKINNKMEYVYEKISEFNNNVINKHKEDYYQDLQKEISESLNSFNSLCNDIREQQDKIKTFITENPFLNVKNSPIAEQIGVLENQIVSLEKEQKKLSTQFKELDPLVNESEKKFFKETAIKALCSSVQILEQQKKDLETNYSDLQKKVDDKIYDFSIFAGSSNSVQEGKYQMRP